MPAQAADRAVAAPFKVLALYNGTWDAAHISFVKEANEWCGRCLNAATTAADSVQLTQRTCDDSAAQSFRLTAQP